jgi:signal transduction histidine kinase
VMKMLYHSLNLKFPEADPRSKDAQIISEKIEHLNKIVEQILDFARTSEPQLSPVNLNQIVDDLALLVRHKLKNQNVALVQNLKEGLPPILGESAQLEQVFLNLILNASEAMPGGGTLTISSRAVRVPRSALLPTHVSVEFRDTGHGMTEDMRRHAFTSVLQSTKRKGTGLGLAIVRRVLESHRGKLKIKSLQGHGTTVAVILPV